MMYLQFIFLGLTIHLAACGFGSVPIPELPQGLVKPRSLEPCETTDTPMVIDAHLDTIRGDDKALSFTATLPFEWNNDITFSLVLDKWIDDEWFLNFYTVDGAVCELLKKYLPKMWTKFAKAVNPNLGDDCPHPPGDYSITNFEMDKGDVTLPSLLYGLFRINFRAYDQDGDNFMCQIMTADVST